MVDHSALLIAVFGGKAGGKRFFLDLCPLIKSINEALLQFILSEMRRFALQSLAILFIALPNIGFIGIV